MNESMIIVKALVLGLLLVGSCIWFLWGTHWSHYAIPIETGSQTGTFRGSHSLNTFETIALSGKITSDYPVSLQTAAWMFNAVHNTMRILGNNVARNGVSFVPGFIPAGTLLYHGKRGPETPPGMEWLAFDAEYSLNMVGGPFLSPNDSYLLTFTNSQPLKVLNIDGASAALFPAGTMDSQGFVLKQPKEDWVGFKEYERANLLCAMGKKFGVDGYVRLNTGFELILCSFQNPKVRLVSSVKLSVPVEDDEQLEERNLDNTELQEAHTYFHDLDLMIRARSSQYSLSGTEERSESSPQKSEDSFSAFDARSPRFRSKGKHEGNNFDHPPFDGPPHNGPPGGPPDGPPGEPPGGPPGGPGSGFPPPPRYRRRRNPITGYEWVLSGVRHFYGDPRMVPDYRGFVTIYGRDGFNPEGPVYTHRLLDAPDSLRQEIRNDLLAVMSVDEPALDGRGINWRTVTDDIVGKFKPLLVSINETFNVLGESKDHNDTEKARKSIEMYTQSLVHRFTNYQNGETSSSPESLNRCVDSWDPTITGTFNLTILEKRILSSVRTITQVLCKYTYDAYFWSSPKPLQVSRRSNVEASPDDTSAELALRLKSLLETLAWVDFMACTEICSPTDVCYFPLWPSTRISDDDYKIGMRCLSLDDLDKW